MKKVRVVFRGNNPDQQPLEVTFKAESVFGGDRERIALETKEGKVVIPYYNVLYIVMEG